MIRNVADPAQQRVSKDILVRIAGPDVEDVRHRQPSPARVSVRDRRRTRTINVRMRIDEHLECGG